MRSHIDDDVDGERDAVSITTFCVAGVGAIFDEVLAGLPCKKQGVRKYKIVQLKVLYEIIKENEGANNSGSNGNWG